MDRTYNGFKVRYEILNEKFLPNRAAFGIKTINIFISLDYFFRYLHKYNISQEFQTTGGTVYKQMVSNIINLAAHYKNWAVKEHLAPNIYLIYTSSHTFKNSVHVSKYREEYNKIYDLTNPDYYQVNATILSACKLLPAIIKYIPHVYLIDTHYLEPSIVPLMISEMKPADWNLLVSKFEYDLQYLMYDNWSVVSPKGDESDIINKKTLWDVICRGAGLEEPIYFHPSIFLSCKTILGDRFRSIPKLTRTGWKTVFKWMNEVADGSNEDSIYEVQLDHLQKFVEARKIEGTAFDENFYCTSVRSQVDATMDIDRNIVVSQLVDMRDERALDEANEKLFKDYPLNIYFLLKEAPPSGYREIHDDYKWRKAFTSQRKRKL